MAIEMSKQTLRRDIVRKRDHLIEKERVEKSEAITRRLFNIEMVAQAEDILLYADFGSEVKTSQIFYTAKRMHKRVFFPKVIGNDLEFFRVEDLADLQVGFKGIQEPFMLKRTGGDWIFAAVAVVPGTVFSREGYRIGYGRGFYDRFLAKYPSVFKIGLAYDLQILEHIPHEYYDVRMDGLVSESEQLFWSNSSK